MSKDIKQDAPPDTSWGDAYVVHAGMPESLTGRIFEVIELAGLTDKQEESAKKLIRKTIWEQFSDAIFIGHRTHSSIRNKYYQDKDNSRGCTPQPITEIV